MKSQNRAIPNLLLKSLVLIIAALFLITSNVQAACDGIKLNKKKTKVSIKNLKSASDGCGAHLFKNHINKSESYLKKRCLNLKGGVASSFDDEGAARKAIATVLKSNMGKVKDIMDGSSNREVFRGSAPVKGTCANKACPTVLSQIKGSEKVFVLLKAKGSGDSRKVWIQTAFPEVNCKCP